ncbi:hypothetical protein [Bathymodiolus platifrons methanotrophic gill symbiont]|uniref:hypothetical protein n=1 Tax=Bathymodiolus platifrons methanotrophic gill symbiont TaxID=113268 RepID=UPI001C8EB294|nr:hypothetical protein [Bathymodiolus platifrons methanotrophic gill symbiont]
MGNFRLVLVSGFIVLSTSSFLMNSGMGLMTAITIAVAIINGLFIFAAHFDDFR